MSQKAIIIEMGEKAIVLPLCRVTAVRILKPVFHLDELVRNQWRLIYSSNYIQDIRKLECISFSGIESAATRYTKGGVASFEGIAKGAILSRVTPTTGPKGMIHLDGDPLTNEWKFLYSRQIISDISQLKKFVIQR